MSLERGDDCGLLFPPELVLTEHIVTVLLGKASPLNDSDLWREIEGREGEREVTYTMSCTVVCDM